MQVDDPFEENVRNLIPQSAQGSVVAKYNEEPTSSGEVLRSSP